MRVVLLGHPVRHSLSPVMQNAAFEATARPERYEALDVPPERLRDYIEMLRGGLYLGANVTVPHKVAVRGLLDELHLDARMVGAVNTVVCADGRLVGHNTDVFGACEGLLGPVRDRIGGARVLLLGAGGGARAVLAGLARMRARPGLVLIAARRRQQ
ncbi:MAG: shikimate dehydrogenase family protein, partial [Candidatus Dormibacteria bacterium]